MIKKQANEEYRVIEGFDGKYLVSSLGNVYSTKRNIQIATTTYTDKRKGTTFNTSYKRVGLSYKGKKKLYPVHRLVATTFIPNPENKRTVNHKDLDGTNNVLSNLEWMTLKENIQHAIANGKHITTTEDMKKNLAKGNKTQTDRLREFKNSLVGTIVGNSKIISILYETDSSVKLQSAEIMCTKCNGIKTITNSTFQSYVIDRKFIPYCRKCTNQIINHNKNKI